MIQAVRKSFFASSVRRHLSQRGLSRHITAKHTSHEKDPFISTSSKTKSPFHNSQLKQLIEKAAAKLSKDDCFQEYRIVFENFKITTSECLPIWEKVQLLFDEFSSAEKFLTKFHILLLPECNTFPMLPTTLTAHLCSEAANLCLEFLVQQSRELTLNMGAVDHSATNSSISSERELATLQYIAGYCFRKVYLKIRKVSFWLTETSQQSLEILKAAKIGDDSQILVNAKNRGGLWQVNSHAQQIFIEVEKVFHEASKDFKTNINCQILVSKVLNDINVTYHFKQISEMSAIKVNKEIAINLLATLITLYIRVRAHSFAKSVREKHKVESLFA